MRTSKKIEKLIFLCHSLISLCENTPKNIEEEAIHESAKAILAEIEQASKIPIYRVFRVMERDSVDNILPIFNEQGNELVETNFNKAKQLLEKYRKLYTELEQLILVEESQEEVIE